MLRVPPPQSGSAEPVTLTHSVYRGIAAVSPVVFARPQAALNRMDNCAQRELSVLPGFALEVFALALLHAVPVRARPSVYRERATLMEHAVTLLPVARPVMRALEPGPMPVPQKTTRTRIVAALTVREHSRVEPTAERALELRTRSFSTLHIETQPP